MILDPLRLICNIERRANVVESFARDDLVVLVEFRIEGGWLRRSMFLLQVSKAGLRDFFARFGRVADATLCVDAERRWSKGFGFVTFSKKEEADRALSAKSEELVCDGKTLRLRPATEKRTLKLRQLAARERRLTVRDTAIFGQNTDSIQSCEYVWELVKKMIDFRTK